MTWNEEGTQICIGNLLGEIIIFDVESQEDLFTIEPHDDRIGTLDWKGNMIATGSKDSRIAVFDIRQQLKSKFEYFKAHSDEVCKIKFNPDGTLLLSGGNDSRFNILSMKSKHSLMSEKHSGAVRGLDWSQF